ncbi:MAG TPA: hypothetical protein VGJ32_09325 [Solirubrobacteraceae bacterium]|jgi:hypothetical protein
MKPPARRSGVHKQRRSRLARTVALAIIVAGVGGVSAGRASTTTAAPDTPSCPPALKFKSVPFSNPTVVNNRFLPMPAGLQMTLEGRANRGGGPLPHKVVFTVTGLTKIINGVQSVVVYDTDENENVLQEAELAFFAQDDARNVWSLGEYPEEYDENGKFVGAPNTWITSFDGAQAGTIMLGNPQLDTPEYLQGFAPEIDFLDCATVFQRDARTCVPVKCYSDMLITDETSPLDPDSGHQRKFYAPRVGNVKITAVDDPEGETLVLTSIKHLTGADLQAVNEKALKLERRGRRVSDVYRRTRLAR